MSPITQHSIVLSDPMLSVTLLIIAFSILIVACLIAIRLRDKALRQQFEEVFENLPDAERKDLIELSLRGGKRRP